MYQTWSPRKLVRRVWRGKPSTHGKRNCLCRNNIVSKKSTLIRWALGLVSVCVLSFKQFSLATIEHVLSRFGRQVSMRLMHDQLLRCICHKSHNGGPDMRGCPSMRVKAHPCVVSCLQPLLLCLLSRNILGIFFPYLSGNFALKNGGDFWWIFSGLRFPRNEARKILKKIGENSERNSGQNPGQKFEKFGELSFCDFSQKPLPHRGLRLQRLIEFFAQMLVPSEVWHLRCWKKQHPELSSGAALQTWSHLMTALAFRTFMNFRRATIQGAQPSRGSLRRFASQRGS